MLKAKDNISDIVSRKFDRFSPHCEWSLSQECFNSLMSYARVTPDVDLFANDKNCKLPRFLSRFPCPLSEQVDAFSISWTNVKGFIFAPFSLNSRVIKKCYDDRIKHICAVFPKWELKTWWTGLERLIVGQIFPLSKSQVNQLHLPWDKSAKHPLSPRLQLIFVNLSTEC